jgi:uncharacterized protein GlcG (DUF336 family)
VRRQRSTIDEHLETFGAVPREIPQTKLCDFLRLLTPDAPLSSIGFGRFADRIMDPAAPEFAILMPCRSSQRPRGLQVEPLESRVLPTAVPLAHNSRMPADVNDDAAVTTQDALVVINALLSRSAGVRALAGVDDAPPPYLDVSNDGRLSPRDVLIVVNTLLARTAMAPPWQPPVTYAGELSADEVKQFLDRASAASASRDAIIAIVDRGGHILGVRVEDGVPIHDMDTLVFAIDGAVAKARTAAFFSNNQAPLPSRTVRYISQSTITQREVESNPNKPIDSIERGPGFVAPIGLAGHFPPGIQNTPLVDLFAIEHTNRDSLRHPGKDGVKGTGDDKYLKTRFDAKFADGKKIDPPESYGFQSNYLATAQSRGIATLPGGIPLYKQGALVGGIGVFFPGAQGYATYEQGFVARKGQTDLDRTNAPRVLEAEWIAYAAAGGISALAPVGTLGGVPPVSGFDLPLGRIDLVGITLEGFAPRPLKTPTPQPAGTVNGKDYPVSPGPDKDPNTTSDNVLYWPGQPVPDGWLVEPHGSGAISAADVEQIILAGVAEAERVRAAIRLPLGQRTRMTLAVSAPDGEVLGLYRMPDSTFFSIDVAVAKSRNTVYYADAGALQPEDQVDGNEDGIPDFPPGTALTNRTFRFLAAPRFPTGAPEGTEPGPFSSLNDAGINPRTAENYGAPLPASAYGRETETSVLLFDAFNPGSNFRDEDDIKHQNGIVFFPGSAPLYKNGSLYAGFGVSGDGVDQDDVVTFAGQKGFEVPDGLLRADEVTVRGIPLPYQKFNRNPRG